MRKEFWNGKKVFITGHTGFKGSWLSLWLNSMGAIVRGYALPPVESHSLFYLARLDRSVDCYFGDIRDYAQLEESLLSFEPDIVFHLAAQPLVRESYRNPIETYETNVMGTVHLLECVRKCESVKVVVNITTDKCYENKEWVWAYREIDSLGGRDPYSSSKVCAEFVTQAYQASFFSTCERVSIATARAGNVIGGGDWAKERLIPDCFRAIMNQEKLIIRNPNAIRPWQHVLEALGGYLTLAEHMYVHGKDYSGAWNFGPQENDRTVEWIVQYIDQKWRDGINYMIASDDEGFVESNYLRLDWSKAREKLRWKPKWRIEQSLDKTIEWFEWYVDGRDISTVCLKQINQYMSDN
ncbi:CDP-glucose 4,6-dehydratase [Anoxybacillus thermarum]|uniref:CDP-glucose 4,6-dehydratase n=1 Tax=Anoxybacillus thermarum TaxID=404937 RepID=A0A0D0S2D3_9BACL|nr:CDP-glucose 4,6-dehydratase [Anoxybacillus thermarum]KIQ95146.1 CDP-glucose 4,6-dehydratase [Anoxybacillus thermarum]